MASKTTLIGVIVGVISILFVAIVANVVYRNWWMIRFEYARWRWLRDNNVDLKDIDIKYDAFVSYSGLDQEWIDQVLVPNLEPGYRLCLHERDFQLGRSITENIVDSIAKSQSCLIILSENYVKSTWCNFEAQVAQAIMKEKLTTIVLDNQVVTEKASLSSSAIKSLVKTRTFITWDEKDSKFWRRIDEAMTRASSQINLQA